MSPVPGVQVNTPLEKLLAPALEPLNESYKLYVGPLKPLGVTVNVTALPTVALLPEARLVTDSEPLAYAGAAASANAAIVIPMPNPREIRADSMRFRYLLDIP